MWFFPPLNCQVERDWCIMYSLGHDHMPNHTSLKHDTWRKRLVFERGWIMSSKFVDHSRLNSHHHNWGLKRPLNGHNNQVYYLYNEQDVHMNSENYEEIIHGYDHDLNVSIFSN
jgi:hypothetical protein